MGDASWQFCWRGFCLLRTGDEQRADDGATLSACALSGQAKRLEAICIALTGDMQRHYDVYYRVHAQSFGWLGWAENGAPAGNRRLCKTIGRDRDPACAEGTGSTARSNISAY